MAKRKPKKLAAARTGRPLALDFQIRRAREEADELIEQEDWTGALRVLQPLYRRAPASLPVMEDLAYVYFELGEWSSYIDLAERIRERTPDRADIYLSLAGAAINDAYLFLATPHLRTFIARFPRHPQHEFAQEQLQKVLTAASALLIQLRTEEQFPLHGEAASGFLHDHERMQVQLAAGHLDQAQQLGEKLLTQVPDWPPVLNNLSLALGLQGHHEAALAYAERTLALRPGHYFATAERIKCLYLLGRTADARAAAAAAVETVVQSKRDDATIKLVEALALLGDDAAITSVYRRAEAAGRPKAPLRRAVLLRFAGVAYARLGERDEARKLWQQCLSEAPGYGLAKQLLIDMERMPADRQGPFYLDSAAWYSRDWTEELIAIVRSGKSAAAVQAAARRFVTERPGLVPLLEPLLDRGDEAGRTFALTVCSLAETPETLTALRSFALGQHGTDEQRTAALTTLMNKNFQLGGKVKLWLRGEWTELEPISFEITTEPLHHHQPHVARLAESAALALGCDDLAAAEQALTAALAEEKDAPDLLNNLALLRGKQGRKAEAQAILSDLRTRFPDYSFTIFSMALQLLESGKTKRALDILAPILRRELLHLSEFTNLCVLQVRALLALGQRRSAREWVQMLARRVPEHPLVEVLRLLIEQTETMEDDSSWSRFASS